MFHSQLMVLENTGKCVEEMHSQLEAIKFSGGCVAEVAADSIIMNLPRSNGFYDRSNQEEQKSIMVSLAPSVVAAMVSKSNIDATFDFSNQNTACFKSIASCNSVNWYHIYREYVKYTRKIYSVDHNWYITQKLADTLLTGKSFSYSDIQHIIAYYRTGNEMAKKGVQL